MANLQVVVTIPPELTRALGAKLEPELRKLTKALADELKSFLSPYPAPTVANEPHLVFDKRGYASVRWYERGYGPRWLINDKSRGGRRAKATAKARGFSGFGVGGRKTSEELGRNWTVSRYGDTGALLSNKVSYAHWVHSADDQAWMHKRTGWQTDQQAIDRLNVSGDIDAMINGMLKKVGLA